MAEIQGKSILVQVSARFELARVGVIGSQLYFSKAKFARDNRTEKTLTKLAILECMVKVKLAVLMALLTGVKVFRRNQSLGAPVLCTLTLV